MNGAETDDCIVAAWEPKDRIAVVEHRIRWGDRFVEAAEPRWLRLRIEPDASDLGLGVALNEGRRTEVTEKAAESGHRKKIKTLSLIHISEPTRH